MKVNDNISVIYADDYDGPQRYTTGHIASFVKTRGPFSKMALIVWDVGITDPVPFTFRAGTVKEVLINGKEKVKAPKGKAAFQALFESGIKEIKDKI